jgi:predicted DsbA family dithiol-disulfide isomerase
VIKDFPLERIHKKALKAHEAANCAGEQDNYWQMHDRMFSGKNLDVDSLKGYAKELGLDIQRFNECLDSGEGASEIRKDLQEGVEAGVRSTPTFLIGLTDPDDPSKVRATVMIRGAQPYSAFKKEIEKLLSTGK